MNLRGGLGEVAVVGEVFGAVEASVEVPPPTKATTKVLLCATILPKFQMRLELGRKQIQGKQIRRRKSRLVCRDQAANK